MKVEKALLLLTCVPIFVCDFYAQSYEHEIDSLFKMYDHTYTPGVAVGVIENGKIVFQKGYGMQDIAHHIPITSRTNFDIGSNAKQFNATAILLLEEEGRLSRSDDIRKYLADFPDYGHVITINHLLHMCSGIRDFLTLEDAILVNSLKKKYNTDQYRYNLLKQQSGLSFIPGEKFAYSNSNYLLLKFIIEKVSGMKYGEYLRQNIFLPLGMTNTFFNQEENVTSRAQGYYKLKKNQHPARHTGIDITGPGGIQSNLEDLLLWDQNYYSNKLGKTGSLLIQKLIATDTLNNGKLNDYANGIGIFTYEGFAAQAHSGGWLAFKSIWVRFPEKQLTVICLSNYVSVDLSIAAKVADLYLGIKKKPYPVFNPEGLVLPNAKISRGFYGLYTDSTAGHFSYRMFYSERDKLLESSLNSVLLSLGDTAIVPENNSPNVMYKFDSIDGRRYVYAIHSSGIDTFVQREIPPYDIAFNGKYVSADLSGFRASVKLKNGKPYFKSHLFLHAAGDRYGYNSVFIPSGNIAIEFVRDEKGEVTGFYASVPRAEKIWFRKK